MNDGPDEEPAGPANECDAKLFAESAEDAMEQCDCLVGYIKIGNNLKQNYNTINDIATKETYH